MPLTPKEARGSARLVHPVAIEHSALIESAYTSIGTVAEECTIALGWKPTKATKAPLNDMTGHYLLTIRKVGNTVTVWAQGTQLAAYGGSVGTTYAEFLQNVLTYYAGSYYGYYSRVVVVDGAGYDYTMFWEVSGAVEGLWIPKSLQDLPIPSAPIAMTLGYTTEDIDNLYPDNNYTWVDISKSIPPGTVVDALAVYHGGDFPDADAVSSKLAIVRINGPTTTTTVAWEYVQASSLAEWNTVPLSSTYTIPSDGFNYHLACYASRRYARATAYTGWVSGGDHIGPVGTTYTSYSAGAGAPIMRCECHRDNGIGGVLNFADAINLGYVDVT